MCMCSYNYTGLRLLCRREVMVTSRFLIYGLLDPRDGTLRYIGKSSSGMSRPRDHARPSRVRVERTHKANWVRSLLAIGLCPQIVVIEEHPTSDDLGEAEQFYIAYFKTLGCRLTNATEGGEGAPGVQVSDSTRAKQSVARRGRRFTSEHRAAIAAGLKGHEVSLETRQKIGARHKGNTYCVGRELSEASRAKMSESVSRTSPMRGKKLSPETRAKMSEVCKGRPAWNKGLKLPPEICAKRKGRPAWNKGQKMSDETRAKMSASHKGLKR